MRYLPALLILLGMVVLMAGSGRRGLRAAEHIVLVIAGMFVLIVAFAWIVTRAGS